jgi:hypothetical protein
MPRRENEEAFSEENAAILMQLSAKKAEGMA